MTAHPDFDGTVRSWLEQSTPTHEPGTLLGSILARTGEMRPRRPLIVRLTGGAVLEHERSGLNRIAPIAAAATALVVAFVMGVALWSSITGPTVGDPPASSPTSEPSSTVPFIITGPTSGLGTTLEERGTYRMRGPGLTAPGWPSSVIVTIPDGWYAVSAVRGGGMVRTEDDRVAALNFSSVGNLVADPCVSEDTRDESSSGMVAVAGPMLEPPIGPSVDDLVAGLRQIPGLQFTEPVDIRLGGWEGKRLDLTHPAGCQTGGFTPLWVTPTDSGESWTISSREGWHTTFWILDIDGLRFVVIAANEVDAPDDVLQDLEAMVDSIVIEP